MELSPRQQPPERIDLDEIEAAATDDPTPPPADVDEGAQREDNESDEEVDNESFLPHDAVSSSAEALPRRVGNRRHPIIRSLAGWVHGLGLELSPATSERLNRLSGGGTHIAAPIRRPPMALTDASDRWENKDSVTCTNCPICRVEYSTQHKHVTKRHCRLCGRVFCYGCTYDKVQLTRKQDDGCWPLRPPSLKNAESHVCSTCYDTLPPPDDGLRRCRLCHQKVRLIMFDAHVSVCEERRAQLELAARPWRHAGGSAAPAPGAGISSSSRPASPAVDAAEAEGCGCDGDALGALPSHVGGCTAALADTSRAAELPEVLLCKVCLVYEANTVILPCGHAVACISCCERCTGCPVCRKPISASSASTARESLRWGAPVFAAVPRARPWCARDVSKRCTIVG